MSNMMAHTPSRLRLPLFTALSVFAMFPCWFGAYVAGQELGVDPTRWKQGYNGLAMLCRTANLRISNELRVWREVSPENAMLIVLGSTSGLPVDVDDFVGKGGAVLIASDQHDYRSCLAWGVAMNAGPYDAAAAADMYRRRDDCPVATRLDSDHPVTQGCKSLITNRPGFLTVLPEFRSRHNQVRRTIATLPDLRARARPGRAIAEPALVVALTWNADARAVCAADQSMFSNQMLTCGDNADFVMNTIVWLRGSARTDVLIIADRQVTDPIDPDQLFITVPPPSSQEVIAALESLPPETLIAFSNSVIAAVEDEGVINDVIPDLINEMDDQLFLRILVLLATVLLFTYLALRLLNRRADWLDASRRSRNAQLQVRLERRQAAALLLDQFRSDVTGGISTPWKAVTESVRMAGNPRDTRRIRREIARAARRFAHRPQGSCTRRRLIRLQRQIAQWRRLHAGGFLEYDSG